MQFSTNKSRIAKSRSWFQKQGLKRREFWVVNDLTREESRVLQEWMPDIIADLRDQLAKKEETGK